MKAILSLALILGFSSQSFAVGRVCEEAAGKAVLGLVKGLKQDVKVELVSAKSFRGNDETYFVKLQGNGFSSPETNRVWEITLIDGGDGCMFKSLKLREPAAN